MNDEIFFQDKLPYMIIPIKDFKQIFINVTVDNQTKMKLEVSLSSSLNDIFKKINSKLQLLKPELAFEPNSKFLKVYNLW